MWHYGGNISSDLHLRAGWNKLLMGRGGVKIHRRLFLKMSRKTCRHVHLLPPCWAAGSSKRSPQNGQCVLRMVNRCVAGTYSVLCSFIAPLLKVFELFWSCRELVVEKRVLVLKYGAMMTLIAEGFSKKLLRNKLLVFMFGEVYLSSYGVGFFRCWRGIRVGVL